MSLVIFCKGYGGCAGFFLLNGIFKVGCFVGFIIVNYTWGVEGVLQNRTVFLENEDFSICGFGQGGLGVNFR